MPRRLIRMFSFAGDTVLDPFAGTGTTALAAMETGRNSISVEVEPAYVDLAERRFPAAGLGARVEVVRAQAGSANGLDATSPSPFGVKAQA
ncbi:MAG: site-specific DNA-methyltransferase [Actinomycetota bacterium]|nr:site-specific DNA-methyltransferase [Actinomycetota bacterium]